MKLQLRPFINQKMNISMKITKLLCVLSVCLGVAHAAFAADTKLVVTGASTIAPLALELGKRFEKQNPGTRVDVQSGGSSRGVADVRNGTANIGMASRQANPDEKDLHFYTIAHDGVALIVHRDNPIKALSADQARAIFTGRITDWKELGGRGGKITVVNKAEGRSTLELFLHYFSLKNSQVKAHVVIGDNQQGIKTVSGNPDAIGYVSIGTAEYEAKIGTPIRLLPMGDVAATTENVRLGKFPLARPLNLVTKDEPSGLVKKFIAFAASNKNDDLIREQFFVPVAR